MKRAAAWILILALSVSLFSGCNTDPGAYVATGNGLTWDDPHETTPEVTQPQEQALTMVYSPDKSMHPLQSTDYSNRALFSLIYQGLFATDPDYNVTPILCKSYTYTDDMRTYTFHIDPRATFSDGTPLTVEDVYQTYLFAQKSAYYSGRFTHFREISVTEVGALKIQLSTAYENLPLLLDIPIVKAADLVTDPETNQLLVQQPVGTGPYMFEKTVTGARLRRRANWWCDAELAVTASSIPLKEGGTPAQIRDAFEFDDVGLVCADPGSDSYADYRCDYELWDCENGNFLYLGCNLLEEALFSDDELRAALTYAIDRTYIADTYYAGFARAATLAVSPQSPYYSASLAARYEYDGISLNNMLAKKNLIGTEIRLLVCKDDTMRLRVARDIGEMLTEAGFVVDMVELSRSRFLEALQYRNYDIYLGQTRLSPTMDLSPFFRSNGSLSYGGLTDAEIYAMCLEALANRGNYYNLHKMVADDGSLIPVLFQSYAVYADRGLVTGLTPSRDNVFYYDLGRTMAEALTDE